LHFLFSRNLTKNLNEHITKELEKLAEIHTNLNNFYNSIGYKKAITTIKKQTEKISDCNKIKNLGLAPVVLKIVKFFDKSR